MWKDYDETYEVSSEGQVRNKIRKRILKMPQDQCGYPCVCIHDKKQRVHRLIAMTFIPNPDNLLEVDHIDRDRTNNRVENLRWATRSVNCLNTEVRKDNKLGVKNVRFTRGRFAVNMWIQGKRTWIGSYKTLEEAITARDNSIT